MTQIPVIILRNISETEANAIRLLDNRLAEDSEWDYSVLKSEIDKLLELDYELEDIGFDAIDYDEILHFEKDETSTHEKDKEDESWLDANIPSIVKLGDL